MHTEIKSVLNAKLFERDNRIAELEEALELIADGGTTGRTQAPALNMPSEDWLRYRISDLERIAVKALRKL